MSHVVFADPSNAEARALGADALEQLGYAAESATWRNAYLLGALELRQGVPARGRPRTGQPRRRAGHEPRPLLRLSRRAAQRREGRGPAPRHQLASSPTSTARYVLNLENCALTYLADRQRAHADATVTLERAVLDRLVLRELTLADAVERGLVTIEGDAAKVVELFGLLDDFTLMFESSSRGGRANPRAGSPAPSSRRSRHAPDGPARRRSRPPSGAARRCSGPGRSRGLRGTSGSARRPADAR